MYTGTIIPINEPDVDTDKIIPAQFLTTVKKRGLGQHLFDRVRKENSRAYPLDDPRYSDASIMLCRPDFGCGSSREHAVWALRDAGFQVLIGTTFLDIFMNNAQLNGLWIIQLPQEIVDRLFEESVEQVLSVSIDMKDCVIQLPWDEDYSFKVDPFYKDIFDRGVDPILYIVQQKAGAIAAFEKQYTM